MELRHASSFVVVATFALFALGTGKAKEDIKPIGSATISSAAASSSASAPKDPPVDTITFKKKDPTVGSSFAESSTLDMQLDITAPKKSSSTMKEKMASKVDILAADGKTVLKAKVAYSEHAKNEVDDGKEKSEASPVKGKTYIIEFKDKKHLVTDENHKKVSAKEEKVVRGDLDDIVGKADPLLTEIPGVPMKVGDKADSLTEALRDLLSGDDKIEFSDASVKLKEIAMVDKEKVGTFDVKVKATIPGSVKVMLDLSGTMSIRESDAKLTSISLAGPVTLSGGPVKGGGTMTAVQTRSY